MPQVEVDGLTINYEETGDGDPLVLLPYLGADHACYAFQLEAFSARYRCLCIDLPGSGESDKPEGPYSMATQADQVAAFLTAIEVPRAHVAGVSFGAAVGMRLAAQHPDRVATLGLHSGWDRTDPYLTTVVEMWRDLARHSATVADAIIGGIFPFCFTPGMYAQRPDFVHSLVEFVRSRPAQPLDAFLAQSDAVLQHDATSVLGAITAPTLITFGRHDLVTSTRFAEPLREGIADAEVVVFDTLSHAGLHEDPETFNAATLDFLDRHSL